MLSKEISGYCQNTLYFREKSTPHKLPFNKEDFQTLWKRTTFIAKTSAHEVRKCIHDETDIKMAIKEIRIENRDIEKIEREIRILIDLNIMKNDYIIEFYGFALYDDYLYCFSELMDFSLHYLYSKVHTCKNNVIFPETLLGCIAKAIIDCLSYCKNHNIMHRDLKPLNILLNRSGEVKLCDFGEAKFLENSIASTLVGTMAYWPPERFYLRRHYCDVRTDYCDVRTDFYDERADIWSLGITLAEVIYGRLPYLLNPNENLEFGPLQNRIKGTSTSDLLERCFEEHKEHYSSNLRTFIALCLSRIYEYRPKYAQLKEDAFYNKFFCANKHFIANEIKAGFDLSRGHRMHVPHPKTEKIENIFLMVPIKFLPKIF